MAVFICLGNIWICGYFSILKIGLQTKIKFSMSVADSMAQWQTEDSWSCLGLVEKSKASPHLKASHSENIFTSCLGIVSEILVLSVSCFILFLTLSAVQRCKKYLSFCHPGIIVQYFLLLSRNFKWGLCVYILRNLISYVLFEIYYSKNVKIVLIFYIFVGL